jgi:hypothetical protein
VEFNDATDNISGDTYSGITHYYLSTDDTTPDYSSRWLSYNGDNKTYDFGIDLSSKEGDYLVVYAWLMDLAGNIGQATGGGGAVIQVNEEAPEVSNVSLNGDGGADNVTGTDIVDVMITATDNQVAAYYLITDNESFTPLSDDTGWDYFALEDSGTTSEIYIWYTFDNASMDNGSTLTLYVWAMDNSGNVSDNYTAGNITYYK